MQAMLLNGSALLNIYTSAAFLLQFYLTLLAVQNSRELPTITFALMQIVPIFIFLGAVLATLVVAASNPDLIHPTLTGMYCEIESSTLNITLTAVGLVGVLTTVSTKGEYLTGLTRAMQELPIVILLINLIRRRKSLHSPGLPAILRHPSVIPRAFGYTFVLFLVFVLGIASLFLKDSKTLSQVFDIVISVGSAVTAVVFATESDILKVWFFWRNLKETDIKEGVPTASV
ncbi:hypothetical protein JR316_0005719 [Psilocybe cubensis]|uniref:Uncharacterized protein n=2 Tax=Psilocybe cubensis TaxID=181762 RepID=A0A8H7Y2I1_PSICU|nr:hypothetical protein JR316_0005719 [Psilocybe cubensis]KAH9481199.1 hypothetical protein JR316_0005719 [Psilocybe cubensis]